MKAHDFFWCDSRWDILETDRPCVSQHVAQKINKTTFETVTVSSPVFVNKTNTNKRVVPVYTVFFDDHKSWPGGDLYEYYASL